jgi:hypothetical protein
MVMQESARRRDDLTDAALARLRGGEVIVRALHHARALIQRFGGHGHGPRGKTGGWDGLVRGRALEGLAMSEYAHEDDEFLRRYLDGEQLLLRRDESRRRPRRPIACLSLTAATLGAPRLAAIGAALALRENAPALGDERLRVLVNAASEPSLSSLDEVRTLLDTRPAALPATVAAWRDAIGEQASLSRPTTAYLIAREDDIAFTAEALFDNALVLRGGDVQLVGADDRSSAAP